jgi:hypothetical protein
MNKEVPFQEQVNQLIVENNFEKPLTVTQANQVISLFKEAALLNELDKTTRRKIIATIFLYLTAGSSPSTHISGKREGERIPFTKISTRQRHRKRKTY